MSATLNREQRAKALSGGPTVHAFSATASPAVSSRPIGVGSRALGGEVFSINFIRHQTLPLKLRRVMMYVALGYVTVNVAVTAMLLVAAMNALAQTKHVQTELQGPRPMAAALTARQQAMQALHQRAAGDLAQLNHLISLEKNRFAVAGKLAALTRTLPARTWITSLSGDRDKRTITIQAAYLVDPEKPFELPAKGWIEALKADTTFRQGLKRLEQGSSSRAMQGSAKLFTFDLVAEWEPVAGR